jgi:hypothetical protein
VHITTASFFDVFSKADWAAYRKEAAGERLFMFWRDLEGTIQGEQVPLEDQETPEGGSALPLMLTVPQNLMQTPGAEQALSHAFTAELFSLTWLLPYLGSERGDDMTQRRVQPPSPRAEAVRPPTRG